MKKSKVKSKSKPRKKPELIFKPSLHQMAKEIEWQNDKYLRSLEKNTTMTLDPQALLTAAIKKGASLDMLNQLVILGERLQAKTAESAFRDAMAKFQFEISNIKKTKNVDFTTKKGSHVNYNYAPLDFIVAEVRQPMYNNGFSFSFTTKQDKDSVTAMCHVHHIAGHTEKTEFTVPIDPDSYMNPAQAVASTLTYSKRYSFCNAFGLVTMEKDTDGNIDGPKSEGGGSKSGIESLPEFKNSYPEVLAEIYQKLEALPKYLQDGFRVLDYTKNNVYLFCQKHNWEDKKIRFEIEKIIKAKEGSK